MITKVYQLTNRQKASFYFKYCGVDVKIEFNGNMSDDGHAQVAVTNKFVQDALEHDSRFGNEYKLANTFGEPDVIPQTTTEPTAMTEKKPTKRAPKKVVVSDVTNINDAYDYFAAHGVVLTTLDELKAQIAKENVEFPNVIL